ncbi:MAG: hypothetical protein IKY83_00275 [Proteobacteria bacterium]|nr:hypothetical protein [Pseudomonadota bacterium]
MAENNSNGNIGCLVFVFLGLLAMGILLVFVSTRSESQCAFIDNIRVVTIDKIQQDYNALDPSVKSSSDPVVVGNYEIKGTATTTLKTPFSRTPCIRYSYELIESYEEYEKDEDTKLREWVKKEHRKPTEERTRAFDLDDGTGVINVDPDGATFFGAQTNVKEVSDGLENEKIPDIHLISNRHEETYMSVEDPITVLGTVYAWHGTLQMKKAPSSFLIVSTWNHYNIRLQMDDAGNGQFWAGIIFLILSGIPVVIVIVSVIRRRKRGVRRG